jgi:hypothetical protein
MSTSKNYDNCPLKRKIQATLFPEKADVILGLSSPRVTPSYLEVLPKHKELYLVNYEPEDDAINANSLVGMFDILTKNRIFPDFVDCDFCDSIKSSGMDLEYIYCKYLAFKRNVNIAFTFAVRGITLDTTINWLAGFGLHLENRTPYDYDFKHRQFAYQYGDLIHYRESGEQMVSGVIKIDKNENSHINFNNIR